MLEPVISYLFGHLMQKLERIFGKDEVKEITKWKSTLRDFRAVLQDAESRREENPALGDWIRDLVDLTCDVEDTIEVIHYEAMKRQVEPSSRTTQVLDVLSGIFGKKRKHSGILSDFTERFNELKDRKSQFNLVSLPAREPAAVVRRPPSTSLQSAGRRIYGRDNDKRKIMNLLMLETEQAVEVITIVGMGGLGKTTLARRAFNEATCFAIKVWICVSLDYDIFRVTVQILKAIDPECHVDNQGLNWIQEQLSRKLMSKRFLIVLDDLWNEEHVDWEALKLPLASGSVGSRVIVTTRSVRVANTVKTMDAVVTPGALSEDDCFSLLCEHAGLLPNKPSFKVVIAKEIAKRCKGLPLAAVTVGGMLRYTDTLSEWRKVRDHKQWSFEDGGVDVMSVLRMIQK